YLTQVGRNTPGIVAFFDELRAHGFVEGGNLSMIPGGFGVAIERIGKVAETMVKAAPDAIVAGPELPLRALQTLTRTIPLIGMTEDMVAEGFAASLARPGGNITGISLLSRPSSTASDRTYSSRRCRACAALRRLPTPMSPLRDTSRRCKTPPGRTVSNCWL